VTSPSRVPRLANETTRSWVVSAITVPVLVAAPIVLLLVTDDLSVQQLTIATVFVGWAALCLIAAAVNIAVFVRADAEELQHWLIASKPRDRVRRIEQLLSGGGSTSWAVTGSVIAVIAVLVLSVNATFRIPVIVYSGIAVVIASLALSITSYAVRYARAYAETRGLDFPGEQEPRFADFLYLAVQVSTTFSSSDVTVQDTATRRVVSTHSLIAFVFNTVIVALLVSVLVSSAS
jgi:hypothetical protein